MLGTLLAGLLFRSLLLAQPAPMSVVSAATYRPNEALAANMLASAFTSAVAAGGAYSLSVRDAAATEHPAQIVSVHPGVLNFVIPAATGIGAATVNLRSGESLTASTTIRIAAVAPGLLTANASATGPPAGQAETVRANGERRLENLFIPDTKGAFLPQPFDLGDPGAQVFLHLPGTGFRAARAVTATLSGETLPVARFSPSEDTPGLDHVTVGPVPVEFAGRWGELDLTITADGIDSNPVTVAPGLPFSGGWSSRAPLLEANSEMAVAEAEGLIYVLGGYPSSRQTVATVQVYDPSSNTWRLAPPLPRPVNHAMPAVVNGKLYLIGGQSDAGNTSFVSTNYEYDPAADRWRERAPLPVARGGGAAAVVDGRIYVAGGRPPRGADFAMYDPEADRWTALPDLPTQRNHLAAVAVNGKVYVIGGRFQAGFTSPQTDVVEIFDPATGAWTRAANMRNARGGINAIEAYGCIHVFGGEGNSAAPSGVYPHHDVYDPLRDTWERLDPMPIPVHGVTGAAFLRGLIYLPGGGTSDGGSSGGTQHQVYRPKHNCTLP